jgi:predicted nucleic acid-binding protein
MKKPARSLPDTNTIIRYLINDDPLLFNNAKGFFEKVKNGEIKAVILESVIAECIYVLTKIYLVPKNKASGRLIDILRYKGIVNNDRQELIDALTLFSEKSLDIVDCILYVKAISGGDNLFTFDLDLNRLNKKDL